MMRNPLHALLLAMLMITVPSSAQALPSSSRTPPAQVFTAPQRQNLLSGAASEVSSSNTRWHPPLGVPLTVSEPFRAPIHAYASGHRGIDIPAAPGTQVFAPTSATVSFQGLVVDRTLISITIDHGSSPIIISMEPVDSSLIAGEQVVKGQVIGTVGHGGHCSEGCMHLGVRVAGDYVNPMRFFYSKPVLLPW